MIISLISKDILENNSHVLINRERPRFNNTCTAIVIIVIIIIHVIQSSHYVTDAISIMMNICKYRYE